MKTDCNEKAFSIHGPSVIAGINTSKVRPTGITCCGTF